MILKNLLRRKGRTLLTVLGISIGVATIITLGSLADGLEAGYGNVLGGSQADFVLTDPNAYDIIMSALDEDIGEQLSAMSEVEAVSPMLQAMVTTENSPYFFIFGYPEGSFVLSRFNVVEGYSLYADEAGDMRGNPLMLGSAAAESMKKEVGDTLRLGDSVFRVTGIYETGDAFEEGGAVVSLHDAQEIAGMQRQVSLFYIQLKDPALGDRLKTRLERLYPKLSLSTAGDLGQRTEVADSLRAMVWGVAALAILIGGVTMMNSQLMAVMERTGEIGVLRAVGWRSRRVLLLILGESIMVSLLGGLVGLGLGYLLLTLAANAISAFGATGNIPSDLLMQAFVVVLTLGIVGGIYPAYRASRLQPVEALRYEGGTMGRSASRLPVGGMAVQNLWRRKGRTLLTLSAIGLTVGAVMVLNSLMDGTGDMMNSISGEAEIVVRETDIADTSLSAVDERVGDQIAAMPGVTSVSGMVFTAVIAEDLGMFLVQGLAPREAAIQRFNVVEGERLVSNRQIMLGRTVAEAQNLGVGDTINLGDMRFRVVGIYESSTGWEEMGGIISLRDAQNFIGRPRKVTLFLVDVDDPNQAGEMTQFINDRFPEAHAALSGEFVEQLPDMQGGNAMVGGIAAIAILIGGMGMMNTMLMSVLERTREIGVLRSLGWRRRAILSLIVRESLALGILGAAVGILVAFGLAAAFSSIRFYGEVLQFAWTMDIFVQSILVALALGLLGGIYPAFRATRLQPVEALRYE